MNIPIFKGFATKHRIKQAEAELDIIKKETEIEKQLVELQVRSALKGLREASNDLAVKRKLMEESRLDLMIAEEKFTVGLATEIELMSAQGDFLQVLKDYNDNRIEYYKSLDTFELATVSSISAINETAESGADMSSLRILRRR